MNKKIRKVISFSLSLSLCVCACSFSGTLFNSSDSTIVISAESSIIDSGSCGENLTWSLTEDEVLTITGSGDMYNYTQGKAPWYDYNFMISKVVMDNSITNIGDYAFYGCNGIYQGNIPESLVRIGNHAFEKCNNLVTGSLPITTEYIGDYAFANCTSITSGTIYDTLKYIGTSAFENCTSLHTINMIKTLDDINDINITIGTNAFKDVEVTKISYNGGESELQEFYKSVMAGTSPNVTIDSTVFEFLSTISMNIRNGEIELDALKYIIGDVNCDGEVKSNDLLLLKKYFLGLETLEAQSLKNADVTLDDKLSSGDLLKLKRALLGLITLEG